MTRAPMMRAELDRGKPDAAGGAEHRQCLAAAHARAVLERVKGGAIGDGQRRGAFEIESAGILTICSAATAVRSRAALKLV